MRRVLTIISLDDEYAAYPTLRKSKPNIKVVTEEGVTIEVARDAVAGWGIGDKIVYSITRQGAEENSELEAAYETISDLVTKGRELAAKAAQGVKAIRSRNILVVSHALMLG